MTSRPTSIRYRRRRTPATSTSATAAASCASSEPKPFTPFTLFPRYSRRLIMSTLIIRDLAHHAEMGRSEMSAVRGGYNFAFPNYKSSFDLSASVQQLAQQTQNTFNQNGNNV